MNFAAPSEGRATLAGSYRNLSEREIRARLEKPLSDAERVTAKAELLRRHASDNGPDTTLATGFLATSAIDFGAVESESVDAHEADVIPGSSRAWPVLISLLVVAAAAVGWAVHAKLIRL